MAAVDRISELPEPILHHILSSLSQKEAIQTSALSKTWRHVGPTRPKIEMRERCFQKSGRASFLSVLGNTLQRYNKKNLSVHEIVLEISVHRRELKSVLDKGILTLLTNMGQVKKFDFSVPLYALDPSFLFKAEFLTELYLSHCNFMTNNHVGKPLFKGLKRLSLNCVFVADETLVNIMLTCPLIEYLLVSNCHKLTTIPEIIFQAESLTELHHTGCKLAGCTQPMLIKRLKTLSLDHVTIPEDTLQEIMCSNPLMERVVLSGDLEFPTNIQLNKKPRYATKPTRTFKTIFLPRLKTLYLNCVKLSAESFESFSSNFPSLQDLELQHCYGFSEIQLTACSIKRLVLTINSFECMVITIYAPNINCFELSVRALPELIFYTETAREWKSHVVVLSNNKVLPLPWLLQLSELLNSLSESQISLDVCLNSFKGDEPFYLLILERFYTFY